MKRILILVAISSFLCWTASAFQGGGGESNKKKEESKKKNSGTKSAPRSKQSTGSRPPVTPRGSQVRPNAGMVTDIRQVDFSNFSYFIDGNTHNGRFFKAQTVTLRDGSFVVWSPDRSYRKHYVELQYEYPRFGDLTNDGKDEAVVLVTSGGDESINYTQGFIYTLDDGRGKLLARFGGESVIDSGAIIDAAIVGGLLILERGDGDNHAFETVSYRSNGDSLVQVANQPGPSAPPGPTVQVFGPGLSIDLGNNVKLELVRINGGTFQMGSGEYDGEKPVHRVTLSQPFYVGKYEVTQAQWHAVMGTTVAQQRDKTNSAINWELKGEGGNYPMYYVDWDEAQGFVVRLNALNNGLTYRLPSEAEWEYAARAGTIGPFAFGASLSSTQANFAGNHSYGGAAKGPNLQKTSPVGSYQPNAWGLYDMHGNVREWCEDVYTYGYASTPRDGSANMSGWSPSLRVLRGGSWDNVASDLRSAGRNEFRTDARFPFLGFRVVAVARTP